jgi:hypothetical protein
MTHDALKFQYFQFSGATSGDCLGAMYHDSKLPRVDIRL